MVVLWHDDDDDLAIKCMQLIIVAAFSFSLCLALCVSVCLCVLSLFNCIFLLIFSFYFTTKIITIISPSALSRQHRFTILFCFTFEGSVVVVAVTIANLSGNFPFIAATCPRQPTQQLCGDTRAITVKTWRKNRENGEKIKKKITIKLIRLATD